MSEFKGQYYCQEQDKYHLEYQGKHYYFDTIKQAVEFMDNIERDTK
jgi:YHS domain-containing protein